MEKNNNVPRKSISPITNRLNDFSFFPSRISDIFDDFMADFPHTVDKVSDPSINVKETDTNHQIQVSAPGYKKENFKIDIDEAELAKGHPHVEIAISGDAATTLHAVLDSSQESAEQKNNSASRAQWQIGRAHV